MPVDIFGFAYAAVVASGGIFGYVKAGSIPSLGAGLLFGGVLGYGAYQASQTPSNHTLILGTSVLLAGMMGMRFYNSGKLMPAGLVALIRYGAALFSQESGLIGWSQSSVRSLAKLNADHSTLLFKVN